MKAFARAGWRRLPFGPMKNPLRCLPVLLLAAPLVFAQAPPANTDPLAPTLGVKSAAEIDREWQQSVSKYDTERNRLLADELKQENDGPFRADWATLKNYQQPQWYKDAKFGIFIHWGVYSVPAAQSEWYPREMYHPDQVASKNFHEHFASKDPSQKDEKGYKDLIPLFRAEHFDATAWAQLFKDSGAQYVVPVAENHDGFSMYDSGLSDWTVVKMGPKRDTLAELSAAIRAQGLHFGLSSHRAEHDFFFDGGRTMRSDVNDPRNASLYGPAHEWISEEGGMSNDWTYVSPEFARDWLARDTELVEKYKPEVVYFDWWAGQPGYRQNITKFAAFYYNFAAAHGYGAVIDIKDIDLNWKAARILDEAARLEGHPDNVAACVLGSIVATAVEPSGITRAIRLEMPEQFEVSVVVPNYAVPTRESRAVLPDCYSLQDVVFNLQRASLLIAALATGDASVFPAVLDDRIHQPYRAQLVPGLNEILRMRKPGLMGCTLSGAGPAVLVFHERGAEEVCELVRNVFAMNGCTTEIVSGGISETGYVLA